MERGKSGAGELNPNFFGRGNCREDEMERFLGKIGDSCCWPGGNRRNVSSGQTPGGYREQSESCQNESEAKEGRSGHGRKLGADRRETDCRGQA